MTRDRLVVGIDVGSTKICTLIARVSEDDGQIEIIGAGVTRSDALRKGVVANIEQAAQDIQNSVQKAEQQSGFKILSAYVGIAGSHLQTEEVHGSITIRRPDRPIGEDEVQRVQESARLVNLPSDRELVDLIPRHYILDGQEEIDSAIGMLGQRLELRATMITGARSAIQNLTTCVERAGVSIDALVPLPLAAGEAVLTAAERESGVALLDIGGGTTDLAVFAEGSLQFLASLQVGGYQVTNDIAVRLRAPFSAAEEIKLRHGQAYSNGREEDRQIDVSSFDTDESSPVSVRTLCDTIEDRLVDTFELARKRLLRAGYEHGLPAGIVMVGGTSQIQGMRRLASEILESPVKIVGPSGVVGLTAQLSSPAFAASVGLVRWGARHIQELAPAPRPFSVAGAFQSVTVWLKGFLP